MPERVFDEYDLQSDTKKARERVEKRKTSPLGWVTAGAATLLLGGQATGLFKRLDYIIGASALRKLPSLQKFFDIDTLEKELNPTVLNTVRHNLKHTSIFTKSIEGFADVSVSGMLTAALRNTGAGEIIKRFDELTDESRSNAISAFLRNAMVMSNPASYLVYKAVGGERAKEQSYGEYLATTALPFSAISSALNIKGVAKAVMKNNALREKAISAISFADDFVDRITGTVNYINDAVKERSWKDIFDIFSGGRKAVIAKIKAKSEGIKGERLGFYSYNIRRLYELENVLRHVNSTENRISEAIEKNIFEEFMKISEEAGNERGIKSILELKSVTVGDYLNIIDASKGKVRAGAQHFEELTELLEKRGIDSSILEKMPIGRSVFEVGGKPKVIRSFGERAADAALWLAENTKIPVIGFNPIALFNPRFVHEAMYERSATVFRKKHYIPTKEGPKSVLELAEDYFASKGIRIPSAFQVGDIIGDANMIMIGNRSVLEVDFTPMIEYIKTKKKLPAVYIDITDTIGEGRAYGKSFIGSRMSKIYMMQAGMLRLPERTSVLKRLDLPFNNIANFEETYFERLGRAAKVMTHNTALKDIFERLGVEDDVSAGSGSAIRDKLERIKKGPAKRVVQGSDLEQSAYDLGFVIDLVKFSESSPGLRKIARKYKESVGLEEWFETFIRGVKTDAKTFGRISGSFEKAQIDVEHDATARALLAMLRGIGPTEFERHIKDEFENQFINSANVGLYADIFKRVITRYGETTEDIMLNSALVSKFTDIALRSGTKDNDFLIRQFVKETGLSLDAEDFEQLQGVVILAKKKSEAIIASNAFVDFVWRKNYEEAADAMNLLIGRQLYSQKNIEIEDMIPDVLRELVTRDYEQLVSSSYETLVPRSFTGDWFRITSRAMRSKSKLDNIASANTSLFFREAEPGVHGSISPLRRIFPNEENQVPSIPSTILHYIADRPISLLEDLGIGRPNPEKTRNALQSISRVFTTRILPIWMGIEALKFGGFLLDTATGGDASKIGAEAVKTIAIGANTVAESLGIVGAARHFREKAPGASASLAFGGTMLLTRSPMAAMIAAEVAAVAEHDLRPTAQLEREVSGEKEVEVRKSRYWTFGRQPVWGSKISYWRPSLIHTATSGWQYTDILYGSKLEYFQHASWLPTPLNLFGFNKLADPYWLERKHYHDRPFPVTGSGPLSEIPIAGKLLAPIDMFIKPPVEMHTEDYRRIVNAMAANSKAVRASLEEIAGEYKNMVIQLRAFAQEMESKYKSKIAKPAYDIYSSEYALPKSENELKERLRNFTDWLKNYAGMIGFMAGTITPAGSQEEEQLKAKVATSDVGFGRERQFYNMELGGMAGFTEYIRRIVIKNYSLWGNQYVNEIDNEYVKEKYPWLPGEDYFMNFQEGDIYSKIPMGEIRLPGSGYEATHELVDNYGLIDQFLVLANVAPYSREYTMKKAAVKKLMARDVLPNEVRYKVASALEGVDMLNERYDLSEYPYSMPMAREKVSLGRYIGEGMFETVLPGGKSTMPIKVYGFETDVDIAAKRIYESEGVDIDTAYSIARAKTEKAAEILESYSGREVELLVPKDKGLRYHYESPESVYKRAIIPETPKMIRDNDLVADTSDDFGKRAVYGTNPARQLWERISHINTFFFEKFAGQYSASEYYSRYETYGKERALWQKPIEDFLKPIAFNTAAGNPFAGLARGVMLGALSGSNIGTQVLAGAFLGATGLAISTAEKISRLDGSPWIPAETRERWELETMYDYLRQKREDTLGESAVTVYGLENIGSVSRAKTALPQTEKRFLEFFTNAPEGDREEIARMVSPGFESVLQHMWTLKEKTISAIESGTRLPESEKKVIPSDRYREYVQANREEWDRREELMSPYVDINAVRALDIYNRFEDISKFDIYYDDIRNAKISLANLQAANSMYSSGMDMSNTLSIFAELSRLGNGHVSMSFAPRGSNMTVYK